MFSRLIPIPLHSAQCATASPEIAASQIGNLHMGQTGLSPTALANLVPPKTNRHWGQLISVPVKEISHRGQALCECTGLLTFFIELMREQTRG
jgi:hypothetical protein